MTSDKKNYEYMWVCAELDKYELLKALEPFSRLADHIYNNQLDEAVILSLDGRELKGKDFMHALNAIYRYDCADLPEIQKRRERDLKRMFDDVNRTDSNI